jgi:transcriptional regulator with XRE-family HTH domain
MRFRERIGLNIQNLRHSKGLSQEQLALAANMDRSYVSEIELAKSSVSADILEQIARVFEVDPHELTKGSLNP